MLPPSRSGLKVISPSDETPSLRRARQGTQRAEGTFRVPSPYGAVRRKLRVPTSSTQDSPPACSYHGADGLPCPTDCRYYHRAAMRRRRHDSEGARHTEEVRKVTELLATGLYALACAQAHVAGRPVPEQRVVCFLNPLGGLSSPRCCGPDPVTGPGECPRARLEAERVTHKLMPEDRTVKIGARQVPTGLPASPSYRTWRGTSPTWRRSRGRSTLRATRRHPRPADTSGPASSAAVATSTVALDGRWQLTLYRAAHAHTRNQSDLPVNQSRTPRCT